MTTKKVKIFNIKELRDRIESLGCDELTDYMEKMCELLHIMQTDLDEYRNITVRKHLYDYLEELICEAEEEQELENENVDFQDAIEFDFFDGGIPITIRDFKATLDKLAKRKYGQTTLIRFNAGHNNISVEVQK